MIRARYIFTFQWMNKRFWIVLFLSLIAVIVVQKIIGVLYISDGFALGMMIYVATLIGLNTYGKKNGNGNGAQAVPPDAMGGK